MDNVDSQWCCVCQAMERPVKAESQAQTVEPSPHRSQAGDGGGHDDDHGGDDHGDDDHDRDLKGDEGR